MNTTLEDKARSFGNDPKQIRIRLLEARSLLPNKKTHWAEFRLDLPNKRMLSDDGTKALKWKIRHNPDEPQSYNNQQTSVGVVELVEVSEVVPV